LGGLKKLKRPRRGAFLREGGTLLKMVRTRELKVNSVPFGFGGERCSRGVLDRAGQGSTREIMASEKGKRCIAALVAYQLKRRGDRDHGIYHSLGRPRKDEVGEKKRGAIKLGKNVIAR